MQNVLKPFGAKDTDSLDRDFRRTRLVLTVVYIGVLSFILMLSTSVTRSVFSSRLEYRLHRYQALPKEEPVVQMWIGPEPDDVRQDLMNALLIVNGALLAAAGVLGYGLAGLTLRPIRDAYDRQRRFLADASHELRTPLAILQTDLENERDASQSPDVKDRVNSRLEEVTRMSALISDLLLLSRLDQGSTHRTVSEKVDLVALSEEIAQRLRPLAEKKTVSLIVSEPANAPIALCSNKELLSQAISNLVKNAIVYNKPNGQVHLTVSRDKQRVIVAVSDTGIGMTPEETAQVFQRFYRVDKSRSRESGGSGLGLSIVQSIVDRLEGSLELESTFGAGTTVRMIFSSTGTS